MSAKNWNYCEISFQILDDGRGSSRSGLGNRLMWLRFIAQCDNKIIGTSKKLPVPNIGNVPLAPQKGNSGHQQVLDDFLTSLKHQGWTLLEEAQGEWWQHRLRMLAPIKMPNKPKLKRSEWFAIICFFLAMLAIAKWAVFKFEGSHPLWKYTHTEVSQAAANFDTAVASMVIINLDTSELDPLQSELPVALAAEDLSTAETVVWLDCDTESNWRGATTDCSATVIDWPKKLILEEQLFEGKFTLHPESDSADALNPADIRNNTAIISYLTELPRK